MELPGINQRIKELINEETFGKVRPFAQMIGFKQHQKLNRLFKPDSRNGEFPMPSTDIILAITERFSDVSLEWFLKGIGAKRKETISVSEKESILEEEVSDSEIMKVIETLYLHEEELMQHKLFSNWLEKKGVSSRK